MWKNDKGESVMGKAPWYMKRGFLNIVGSVCKCVLDQVPYDGLYDNASESIRYSFSLVGCPICDGTGSVLPNNEEQTHIVKKYNAFYKLWETWDP